MRALARAYGVVRGWRVGFRLWGLGQGGPPRRGNDDVRTLLPRSAYVPSCPRGSERRCSEPSSARTWAGVGASTHRRAGELASFDPSRASAGGGPDQDCGEPVDVWLRTEDALNMEPALGSPASLGPGVRPCHGLARRGDPRLPVDRDHLYVEKARTVTFVSRRAHDRGCRVRSAQCREQ